MYQSQENNRLTLIHFIVGSLDVLGAIDEIQNKKEIIDYIYSLQVLPDKDDPEKNYLHCGFRGSPFLGLPYNPECQPQEQWPYDNANIAMTYVSIALLLALGDDFSRLNKKAILRAIKELQLPDGSFKPHQFGGENDVRFVYCACAISYFLNDWSSVNIPSMIKYIFDSMSYDYGIAQGVGQESHAGGTFCALASLSLAGKIDVLGWKKEKLIEWCVNRQVSGFQGRCNKDADSCYSFWVEGSLSLLGAADLIDQSLTKQFTYSCQKKSGGFSKVPGVPTDVLHTFYSLYGLSIAGETDVEPVHAALGISARAAAEIPKLWSLP